MRRVTLTVAAFGSVMLLGGCAWDRYVSVRTDVAVWDRVERREYAWGDGLIVDCVRNRGAFTTDRRACLVQGRHICFYLTLRGDRREDRELTARCNGWRP